MVEETSAPTVDELEAKTNRLTGDVGDAEKALNVAKKTFADAAKSDPTAVEALLELATAVKTAEGTVGAAQRAVKSNQTAIDGIRYDESMAGVVQASLTIRNDVVPVVEGWFEDNSNIVSDYAIDTLVITANRQESGAVTVSVKPTGENMPKRPSTGRGGGGGGAKSKRTVEANGVSMSCRDYVAACGDEASPAAQADLAGTWEGQPVSYTNEAKRLAAKRGDTFA